MKRRAGITLLGTMLALALWAISAYSATEEEEAQKAVLKLVDSMNGKKGDVKAQTQAIKKQFEELKPIMWVYKPRKKGGLGWGKEGSDIEMKIGSIGSTTSKEKLTPKKVADMKVDLIRAADLSRAIAEVSKLYPEQYKDDNGKKNPAKWKEYTEKMSKAADELREAAKDGEVAKIKTAANNLKASCTECHGVFRND